MKKLFRTFCAVALIGAIATTTSCNKTCDTGYEGDKCDTKVRTKFIGQWNGSEICTAGSDNYVITITEATSDILKVTVSNLYNNGSPVLVATATVDGTTMTIASQNAGGGVTVQGSGTVSGSSITITYSLSDGTNSNSCTFTGTKL